MTPRELTEAEVKKIVEDQEAHEKDLANAIVKEREEWEEYSRAMSAAAYESGLVRNNWRDEQTREGKNEEWEREDERFAGARDFTQARRDEEEVRLWANRGPQPPMEGQTVGWWGRL